VKVRNSLRSLKKKPGAQIVRRRGRTFVINKKNPQYKARPYIAPDLWAACLDDGWFAPDCCSLQYWSAHQNDPPMKCSTMSALSK
jgi:large subunit ribosomal protein L36